MKKSTAKILLGKSESELVQLLEAAYARIEELEKQNVALKRRTSKFKTQAARERQRASSIAGQLKAVRFQVQSIKVKLKKERTKLKKAKAIVKRAQDEVTSIKTFIKQIQPKLTKEQVFEMYKTVNLNRFWDRVLTAHSMDPEKVLEMQNKMNSWTSQKLRDFVRVAGLRSTWYDSDAQWNTSELTGWDERNLYAMIMSF